jgi:hypothetical protein
MHFGVFAFQFAEHQHGLHRVVGRRVFGPNQRKFTRCSTFSGANDAALSNALTACDWHNIDASVGSFAAISPVKNVPPATDHDESAFSNSATCSANPPANGQMAKIVPKPRQVFEQFYALLLVLISGFDLLLNLRHLSRLIFAQFCGGFLKQRFETGAFPLQSTRVFGNLLLVRFCIKPKVESRKDNHCD